MRGAARGEQGRGRCHALGGGGVESYKSQRERAREKEREREEDKRDDKAVEHLMRECEKERESMQLALLSYLTLCEQVMPSAPRGLPQQQGFRDIFSRIHTHTHTHKI